MKTRVRQITRILEKGYQLCWHGPSFKDGDAMTIRCTSGDS